METAAVFVVIRNFPGEEGKVLLVHDKNVPLPERWKLAGGKVKSGEFFEVAALRELQEELGINVILGKEVFRKKVGQNHIFVVYESDYYSGSLFPKEVNNFLFCSKRRLSRMLSSGLILPNHAEALKSYLKYRRE